jgi:hypothetical protein
MAAEMASLPGLKTYILRQIAVYNSTVEEQWGLPRVEDYHRDWCEIGVFPSPPRASRMSDKHASFYKVIFHREEVNLFGEIKRV